MTGTDKEGKGDACQSRKSASCQNKPKHGEDKGGALPCQDQLDLPPSAAPMAIRKSADAILGQFMGTASTVKAGEFDTGEI